jgi:hypothetical protein
MWTLQEHAVGYGVEAMAMESVLGRTRKPGERKNDGAITRHRQ